MEQDPVAKPTKVIRRNFTNASENVLKKNPVLPLGLTAGPARPKSPLRPPNFYTVRLSNAPIFLRRTTLRPPTLEFLNRSPNSRRSHSPVNRSSNQSPVNRGQSPISRGNSPFKQEVFVQRRQIQNNEIMNESSVIDQEQRSTEENFIKLINEAVQTGPLKKTHGTQMTPYDSESSEIAGNKDD